jgi:hypothetical protein
MSGDCICISPLLFTKETQKRTFKPRFTANEILELPKNELFELSIDFAIKRLVS